ncbi:MAG: hypothetical protein WBQ86_14435 [Candidatus Binatus sp.]
MTAAEASIRPKDRWFQPITRREAAWLVVGSLAFALVFSYPILGDLVYLGPGVSKWISAGPVFGHLARLPVNGDWDEETALRWVAYQTTFHFRQFPFWNPYKCGGMPMLGNPEAIVATPFLLLDMATGPTAGVYLQIVLHMALGFAGCYVLARVMGLGALAGLVLASVFLSCSWLYLQLSLGNLQLSLPIAYWPWILALFFVGIDRRRFAPLAVGGVTLALTATEGNYTFIYAVILVAVLSPVIALTRRSIWPVIAGIVLVVFGAAVGAIKLLPVAEFLALYPRVGWAGPDADTLSMIPTFLFSRNQDLYREIPGLFVFACYGAYVSPAFALLAVLGLLTGRLKTLPWVVAAIVFLLLARGNTGPYCALMLLRRLPLFGNLAFPTRFIYPFVLALGAIAAHGADFVCRRTKPWGPRAIGAVLIIGLSDAWLVGPPNLRYLFHYPAPTAQYASQFRQFWSDNTQVMTDYNESNLGAVHCYGSASIPPSVVGYNQANYSGEYHLVGPGQITQIEWTPNQLRYHVSATAPTELVVNQNYFPGWRVERGVGDLASQDGLLAVRLPAGSQDITLRFLPQHLAVAVTSTLLGLIATILLWKKGY